MIVAAKVRKGLKWAHVAENIGMSKSGPPPVASARWPLDKARRKPGQLFELSDEAVAWLQIVLTRACPPRCRPIR